MVSQQLKTDEQLQRLRVEMEPQQFGKQVKVRVESFDEKLGRYTSGSLRLPLYQLPLLEQAIADMRGHETSERFSNEKIIAFPG